MILDLFAGPGGWDHGTRLAGYVGHLLGVEFDAAACQTATAAGHPRLRADVAALDPAMFVGVDGLIASPPCQAWSMAGDRRGELDREAVFSRITAYARSRDPEPVDWHDDRSVLTAEPMRYAAALRPRWIALEQVPPVLPLWEHTAALLRELGYRVWTGVLSAERYGVPQTRKRAILIARRDGAPVGPPEPTHQEYRAGQAPSVGPDLFGDPLPPPVSMADALGWGLPERPAWTVTAGGTDTGGAEVFGNAKCRQQLRDVVYRSNYNDDSVTGTRTTRHPDEPSTTITGKVGHWVMRNGAQERATERGIDEPAGTIYCSRPGNLTWSLRNGNQDNATTRHADEPAGTLFFGERINAVDWQSEGGESVRVSVREAGVLQGFPHDYPWQGTKSQQYRQIGDAVPPPLAAAILRPLIHHHATALEAS